MKPPPGYIPPRREGFPAELVAIAHWVAWRLAPRTGKDGEVKLTKEPIDPHTGGLGKSTDSSTWGTLDQAWTRFEQDGLGGVGFALNGDGLVGIDIDDCRDPLTGEIAASAMKDVRAIDSYTEVSPSGTGLRIFARGALPAQGRKRGPYEMYVSGRYLTVTGARVDGTPATIEDRPEQVLALHKRVFGEKAKKKTKRSAPRDDDGVPRRRSRQNGAEQFSDDEVIARARAARSGKKFVRLLDTGEWSAQGYPSQSEADLALCSMLARAGADADSVDRIFRASRLYRRKWDERHSADGSTYGEMTIAKALFELRPDEPDEEVAVTYHPNNAGRRMVRMYGDDLLFCGGEWFCWDAKRWCVDKSKHVERLTRAVVETYKDESADLYAQAAAVREEREEEEDRKRKDELEAEADRVASRAAKCWQFHVQMSRPKGVKDIAEAASWDLVVQHSELDSDPYVLNAQNGVIDLRTGELLPHRRCDLITKITPGDYNPDAESDLWRLYLDAVFGDDDDMRRYVQRLLGSALVGLQTEDLIILLIGPGGTGKTTFLEACRRAIGDYGKPVPFDIFLEKKHSGGTTPELASLPGVRMVTSAEPKENVGFDVARLKMLSGGDEVMANPKYLAAFTFDPAFTIVLATNFAPKASGTDSALWRRVKAIRFERVIAKPNRKLRQHLAGKLPGKEADPRHQQAVLAWLVEGCRDYLENGLGDPPGAVLDSTDSTRREMDPLWGFLAEECVLDPAAWTPTDVLYRSYKLYATERGMTLVDDAAWGTTLNRFGATVRRRTVSGRTRRGWEGIRLRDADHDADHDAAQKEGNRPSDAWKGDSGRHDAE